VPSAGDNTLLGRQEVSGHSERIANAEAKLQVQFSGQGQMDQRRMRDASCHAASMGADSRDGKVGKQVVEPLVGGADGK
jgi:hypothetical protein